jgi:hypothetical protein
MTALSADANREKRGEGRVFALPVAGDAVIHKGALVGFDADGFAIPASDTASQVVAGVAMEAKDATGLADGAVKVRVQAGAEWKFIASSITQAMLGVEMVVVDDNTIDDAAGATNDVPIGRLTEFISTTLGWVYVPGLTRP